MQHDHLIFIFFFFNDTATTEIYTLSLHDALPILVMNADVQAVIIKDNFRFKSQFDAPLLRSYLEQHLSQECGSLEPKDYGVALARAIGKIRPELEDRKSVV